MNFFRTNTICWHSKYTPQNVRHKAALLREWGCLEIFGAGASVVRQDAVQTGTAPVTRLEIVPCWHYMFMLLPFKQAILFTTQEKNFVLDSVEKVTYLGAQLAENI